MVRRLLPPVLASAIAIAGPASAGTGDRTDAGPDLLRPGSSVRRWTIDDGLPQSSVTAIAQTRDGYLWLGTQGGVARRVLRTGEGNGTAATRDAAGRLWFPTLDGVVVVDTATSSDDTTSPPATFALTIAPHFYETAWFLVVVIGAAGLLGITGYRIRVRVRGIQARNEALRAEITERRRATGALRASEARYRDVVETSTDLIWSLDARGRWTFVNRAAAQIYGYPPEEMIGTALADLVADVPSAETDFLRRLDRGERLVNYETIHVRKDGRPVHLRFNAIPLTDGSGTMLGATGTATDITERKRAESLLREIARGFRTERGEAFFGAIVQHLARALGADHALISERMPDAPGRVRTIVNLVDGVLVDNIEYDLAATPCGEVYRRRICAYHRSVQRLFPDDDLLVAADVQAFVGALLLDSRGGASGHMAVMFRRPLESTTAAEAMLEIFSARVAMEIDRIQADRALIASERRYRTLVDHATEAIVVIDADTGRLVDANDKATRLFGHDRDTLLEKRLADLSPPRTAGDRPSVRVLDRAVHRAMGGETPVYEWIHLTAGRKEIQCEVRLVRLPAVDRHLVRGSIVDIGARKRAEQALRSVAEGISAATGEAFFRSLVSTLVETLGVDYSFVGTLPADGARVVTTVAVSAHGEIIDNFSYDLAGTPCANIVDEGLCVYARDVSAQFPDDPMLGEMGVESYAGVPLRDTSGNVVGLLVVLDGRPVSDPENLASLLTIFGVRASSELERMQSETRQKRLMAELDHRVKNTLASVLSLADRTVEQSKTLAEFSETFGGRIHSLARTHEALAASRWSGVDLREVVRLTIPEPEDDSGRVVTAGPLLCLPAKVAPPLCMTLHELVTNALKHGALAGPDGIVEIKWRLDEARRVRISWQERNGPPLEGGEPKSGFGLTLIRGFTEHELAGRADLRFSRSGFACELVFPLENE